jgi:hypothetical protein
MKNNRTSGMRRKALLIIALVVIGITSGSIYLIIADEPEDILMLDFVNGKVILDAEDRELLRQEVINITLENDKVKELTDGKNFTTHVTLVKSIQDIEEIAVDDAGRRIFIEFDYVAVVTLIFEDGSGYSIPVNWKEWTVGEPEYSSQVTLPESLVRVGPSEKRSTIPSR